METRTHYTVAQAAQILDLSPDGVRYLILKDKLSSKTSGPLNTTIIPRVEVDAMAVSRRQALLDAAVRITVQGDDE